MRGYDADPTGWPGPSTGAWSTSPPASLADVYAGADVAFVAVTVSAVADAVAVALDAGVGAVSDVGSVKAPVVRAVEARRAAAGVPLRRRAPDGRFGREDGIEGADADLFVGAAWVLTPTAATDPAAFTAVRDLVALTGAEVVAVDPELHDELVAIVSHLPHLAASALMHLATDDQRQPRRPSSASPPAASGR